MHSIVRSCFVLFLGWAPAISTGAVSTDAWALDNARIVDPRAGTVVRGALLIEADRIVGRVEKLPSDFSGTVVDIEGRFVIPGLIDAHVHSFGNMALGNATEVLYTPGVARRALYAGVTGFLDLFSLEPVILTMRDHQRIDADKYPGATVYAAGPCLTATEGHCTEYGVPTRVIDSPEDAHREIADLATKRPDVVKVVYDNEEYGGRSMPTIDRATLEAAVEAARDAGVPTVIHIGTWTDVRHAVLAGATAVTHTPSGPVPDDLPALMKSRGTMIIPTLAVQSELSALLENPALLDDPLARAVTSEAVIASYRDPEALSPRFEGWVARQKRDREEMLRSIRRLANAGVTIVAGTDAGNVGLLHGWSLHRELEKLVDAGLSAYEALAAASVHAGALLGEELGSHVGARADLVVLDASPIDDIRNTRKIDRVIQNGRIVDRPALIAKP